MTQDDQNPTMEDFKKSREIISEDRLQGIRNGNSVEVIMRLELAQALRDERKGLEDQVLHLNEFNGESAERIKALEAENENAKFSFDALVKKYEAILYENSKMMLTYNDECKKYEAEVARLKAEVEEWKRVNSADTTALNDQHEKMTALEARLAEAVRVLEWYAMIDGTARLRPEGKKLQITIDASLAKTFLRSCLDENPTPQEPVYIKEHKEVLPFMKNIKAGDLDPEARGGCEHDDRKIWQGETYFLNKSDYPTCPFCDKKTGGV